eukprot:EG_transcript_28350
MSSVDDGSDYPSGSDEELGGDEVTGINVDVTGNLTEDDERELKLHPEAIDAWQDEMEEDDAHAREEHPDAEAELVTEVAAAEPQGVQPAPSATGAASGVFAASRVKRIMNADPDVRMISADALVCMAHAAELFVGELAYTGCKQAVAEKRKTINCGQFARGVAKEDCLQFLSCIFPDEKASAKAKVDFFRRF